MKRTSIPIIAVVGCLLGGCMGTPDPVHEVRKEDESAGPRPTRFQETIHRTYDELGVTLPSRRQDGSPVRVGCPTCHRIVEADERNRFASEIGGFHGAVELAHGELTCRACHADPDFEEFRLSSGRTVSYAQVMDLCGQCHGTVLKDYRHGVHGGMTGHWDLDSGPRERNHCLDCHHAHKPGFLRMQPVAPPRYREQLASVLEGGGHHE